MKLCCLKYLPGVEVQLTLPMYAKYQFSPLNCFSQKKFAECLSYWSLPNFVTPFLTRHCAFPLSEKRKKPQQQHRAIDNNSDSVIPSKLTLIPPLYLTIKAHTPIIKNQTPIKAADGSCPRDICLSCQAKHAIYFIIKGWFLLAGNFEDVVPPFLVINVQKKTGRKLGRKMILWKFTSCIVYMYMYPPFDVHGSRPATLLRIFKCL